MNINIEEIINNCWLLFVSQTPAFYVIVLYVYANGDTCWTVFSCVFVQSI